MTPTTHIHKESDAALIAVKLRPLLGGVCDLHPALPVTDDPVGPPAAPGGGD